MPILKNILKIIKSVIYRAYCSYSDFKFVDSSINMNSFDNRLTGDSDQFRPATETTEEWKNRFLKEQASASMKRQQEYSAIEDRQKKERSGKFIVAFDDGDHFSEIGLFETISAAEECFKQEISFFKEDPEEYCIFEPEQWTEDDCPRFVIKSFDENGDELDQIFGCWIALEISND